MNPNLVKINEIKNQKIIHGIFYCKSKDLKKTKYGDDYIVVSLADNTGVLNSKLWKNIEFYKNTFCEGDIVCVKANPNIYREKIELSILHISKAKNEIYKKYGFSQESNLPKVIINDRKIWSELIDKIDKTGEKSFLIKKLYSDYKKKVQVYPIEYDIEKQVESTFLFNTYKSIKILELLDYKKNEESVINYELVFCLIYLSNFHFITGYEKNTFYKMSEEADSRGIHAVFFDIFKKYKKYIKKEHFNILEKIIFNLDSEVYKAEKELYLDIFSLVKNAE